jgi:hypothetical protein
LTFLFYEAEASVLPSHCYSKVAYTRPFYVLPKKTRVPKVRVIAANPGMPDHSTIAILVHGCIRYGGFLMHRVSMLIIVELVTCLFRARELYKEW